MTIKTFLLKLRHDDCKNKKTKLGDFNLKRGQIPKENVVKPSDTPRKKIRVKDVELGSIKRKGKKSS
jgi:hypothetical protein